MPKESRDCHLAPGFQSPPDTRGLHQYWLFLSAIRKLGQIQLHTTLPGPSGARGRRGLPLLRGSSRSTGLIPRAVPCYHATQKTACIPNGETESGDRKCCFAPNYSIPRAEISGLIFPFLEHPNSVCWPMACPPFRFIRGPGSSSLWMGPQIGGRVGFGFSVTPGFAAVSPPSCKLAPSCCSTRCLACGFLWQAYLQ